MKIVALLPMKAHSARVSGKNFKLFNTKPLFRWILDTLLSVEEIERIIINTDARSILEDNGLVTSGKVFIRDRRPEICGDLVSMNRVIEDDVQAISAEAFLMTHTTNPLLTKETIKKAILLFDSHKLKNDSLFTVTKYQSRFYREDGSPVNHDPNNLVRTQDLDPWFEENSNLYIFTRESFMKSKARIGRRPLMMEVPRAESVDIDDQETWHIAEALSKFKRL